MDLLVHVHQELACRYQGLVVWDSLVVVMQSPALLLLMWSTCYRRRQLFPVEKAAIAVSFLRPRVAVVVVLMAEGGALRPVVV